MYRVGRIFSSKDTTINITAISVVTIFEWFCITTKAVKYNGDFKVTPDINFQYYCYNSKIEWLSINVLSSKNV